MAKTAFSLYGCEWMLGIEGVYITGDLAVLAKRFVNDPCVTTEADQAAAYASMPDKPRAHVLVRHDRWSDVVALFANHLRTIVDDPELWVSATGDGIVGFNSCDLILIRLGDGVTSPHNWLLRHGWCQVDRVFVVSETDAVITVAEDGDHDDDGCDVISVHPDDLKRAYADVVDRYPDSLTPSFVMQRDDSEPRRFDLANELEFSFPLSTIPHEGDVRRFIDERLWMEPFRQRIKDIVLEKLHEDPSTIAGVIREMVAHTTTSDWRAAVDIVVARRERKRRQEDGDDGGSSRSKRPRVMLHEAAAAVDV